MRMMPELIRVCLASRPLQTKLHRKLQSSKRAVIPMPPAETAVRIDAKSNCGARVQEELTFKGNAKRRGIISQSESDSCCNRGQEVGRQENSSVEDPDVAKILWGTDGQESSSAAFLEMIDRTNRKKVTAAPEAETEADRWGTTVVIDPNSDASIHPEILRADGLTCVFGL